METLANGGTDLLFSQPNFNDLHVTQRIQIHSDDLNYDWVEQNYGFIYHKVIGLFIQEFHVGPTAPTPGYWQYTYTADTPGGFQKSLKGVIDFPWCEITMTTDTIFLQETEGAANMITIGFGD